MINILAQEIDKINVNLNLKANKSFQQFYDENTYV